MRTKWALVRVKLSDVSLAQKLFRAFSKLYPDTKPPTLGDVFARGRETIHAELSKAVPAKEKK